MIPKHQHPWCSTLRKRVQQDAQSEQRLRDVGSVSGYLIHATIIKVTNDLEARVQGSKRLNVHGDNTFRTSDMVSFLWLVVFRVCYIISNTFFNFMISFASSSLRSFS